jgi:hypothetical protein
MDEAGNDFIGNICRVELHDCWNFEAIFCGRCWNTAKTALGAFFLDFADMLQIRPKFDSFCMYLILQLNASSFKANN